MTGNAGVFSCTTINWGDGNTSPGTVTWVGYGHYPVTGSHTYAEEGSYEAKTNIVDSGSVTPPQINRARPFLSATRRGGRSFSTVTGPRHALGTQTLATFTDPGWGRAQRRGPLLGLGDLGRHLWVYHRNDHLLQRDADIYRLRDRPLYQCRIVFPR